MSLISVIRRDDLTIRATFKDSDGAPIDITGYTVFFTVKARTSDADEDALIAKTITSHTTPAAGITSITLSNTDTNLVEGSYYYDFQIKDLAGNVSSTPRGVFAVAQDITERVS